MNYTVSTTLRQADDYYYGVHVDVTSPDGFSGGFNGNILSGVPMPTLEQLLGVITRLANGDNFTENPFKWIMMNQNGHCYIAISNNAFTCSLYAGCDGLSEFSIPLSKVRDDMIVMITTLCKLHD